MLIVADENIPYIATACTGMGEVKIVSGRAITDKVVAGADVLLVRSITRVDEGLLANNSCIRFVGSATIGTDHVDCAYLKQRNIAFASAPGSNANSVAEYVIAALLHLAKKNNFKLGAKTLGIIGVGNVGSKVAEKASVLGMRVLKNDLPRALKEGMRDFVELSELLALADIVTLHVPLTVKGRFATRHLAGKEFLQGLKQGAIFINTSRGAVCDNQALLRVLNEKKLVTTVLDVWENEPSINCELLQKVTIATPHIAGYSFDGKIAGTLAVVNAARKVFSLAPAPLLSLPVPEVKQLELENKVSDFQAELATIVPQLYDIMGDDCDLRKILALPPGERAAGFDKLRKEYRCRREFCHTSVKLSLPNPEFRQNLKGLGFNS